MLKKVRDTASETLDRAKDLAGDVAERAKPLAASTTEKTKDVAREVGQVAKTAGQATAGGAKTAAHKTGIGFKTASAAAGRGARRAGDGAKNVARCAATGAVVVGSGVAGTATELGAKAWDKVDDKVETCWMAVRETFIETVGTALQSAVEDDATMEKVFKAMYSALPADMRRWVSEEQFRGFCFKNRDRLIGAALQAHAEPEVSALPAQNETRVVDV